MQRPLETVADEATRVLLANAFSLIDGMQKDISALKKPLAPQVSLRLNVSATDCLSSLSNRRSLPPSRITPLSAWQEPAQDLVLVSGFFDIMHSGHIKFFSDAAKLGQLHVCVGTNANHRLLRGVDPTFSEEERLYMVQSISAVHDATLAAGGGSVDFAAHLESLKPTIFYITARGDSQEKRDICQKFQIRYVVGAETVEQGLQQGSAGRGVKGFRNPLGDLVRLL